MSAAKSKEIDRSPEEAFDFINKQMLEEDLHGTFHSDISWGGVQPSNMWELYNKAWRLRLGGMLRLQNKYSFSFAPPCPLDGWVLVVTKDRLDIDDIWRLR